MAIADQKSYLQPLSAELMKIWPENRTINIVCHGHSAPAGYAGFHAVDTFNAYPHLLHRMLKERYPMAVINVIVTAIGGECSAAGEKRFASDVLPLRPDLITIDYALNDRFVGLEKAEQAWRSMIEQALARKIKVLLLTPGLEADCSTQNPELAVAHAEQIRRLAAEYEVGLADCFEAFQQYCAKGGQISDLLSWINHCNRDGHRLIAREIFRWLPILAPT